MGGAATATPFGDGRLCVGAGSSGLVRDPWFISSAAFGRGWSLRQWHGIVAGSGGAIVPGATWYFQLWYRDLSGPCGSGFNLSNGVQVAFVL